MLHALNYKVFSINHCQINEILLSLADNCASLFQWRLA